MTIERLERLRYAKDDEDYDGLSILGLEQEHDFTHYHDVRSALHQQAAHDWGVAFGLEVSKKSDRVLTVSPGVAIDAAFQLVALSTKDAGKGREVETMAAEYKALRGTVAYVTIQYHMDSRRTKDTASQPDRQEWFLEPLVYLKSEQTIKDEQKKLDEPPVVLAVVRLDKEGKVSDLGWKLDGAALERKLVGVPAGEIRLRRSEVAKDEVHDLDGATIGPTALGKGVAIDGDLELGKGKSLTISTNALIVDAKGKVGIGKAPDPKASLDVDGELKSGQLTIGANALVVDAKGKVGIGKAPASNTSLDVDGEMKSGQLTIGTNALVVDAKGNVGIGKPDPKASLDVKGEIAGGQLTVGTKALVVDAKGKVGVGKAPDPEASLDVDGKLKSGQLTIGTNALVVDAKGNVGIGRPDPKTSLDVKGEITSAQLTVGTKALVVDAKGKVGIGKAPDPKTSLDVDGELKSGQLTIGTNALVVDANGNVWVGTAPDPEVSLDDKGEIVSGKLTVDQIEVKTANGGTISFGASLGQHVNLFVQNFAIGIQNSTQYFRSGKNFAWYTGGEHDNGELNPGKGKTAMVLSGANLTVGGSVMFDGFLGTDGCINNVRKEAERLVQSGPVGSLVLFVSKDHTTDLCYAFKDIDGVKCFGCHQASYRFVLGKPIDHTHK